MKGSYNTIFGIALRNLRKKTGKTQETLAFDARLDRTYISLLELGQRSPSLDTLFSLCDGLEISLVELAAEIERCMNPQK
jgi:transcriptional regulator with XRE-family HTH domain